MRIGAGIGVGFVSRRLRRRFAAAPGKRQRDEQYRDNPQRRHAAAGIVAGGIVLVHRQYLLRAAAIAARTLSGAVPPKLVRLATDRSTSSTSYTEAVIAGSIACISTSNISASDWPSDSARLTISPVAWWAWRNGMPSVRTSQSARSVAVL